MIRKLKNKLNNRFRDKDFSEIFKKGFSGSVISGIGRFFGFLLIYVISHQYGAEAMGVYTVCLSILSIVGLLGRFGIDTTLSRFVAQYRVIGRWDLVRHTYNIAIKFLIPLSIFLSVATYFAVPYISPLLFDETSPN